MKKITKCLMSLTFMCGLLAGCGTTKPAQITQVNKEVDVVAPCENFVSDAEFFRGVGFSQSKDLNTAREKARMNANTEMAGSISSLIKRVAERYVNDAGQKPSDFAQSFESMGHEVVKQQMSNITIACSKATMTTDGMYKYYMAVETRKDQVFAAIDRNAEADKKLETIYNREKFRKHFDAEMAAMAKEH